MLICFLAELHGQIDTTLVLDIKLLPTEMGNNKNTSLYFYPLYFSTNICTFFSLHFQNGLVTLALMHLKGNIAFFPHHCMLLSQHQNKFQLNLMRQ